MGILVVVVAGTVTACWMAYLAFCRWLVRYTGGSAALRDAAVAARAFPGRANPGAPLRPAHRR
jgi:hypothetical protein